MKLNDQNLNEGLARIAALAGKAKPRHDQQLKVLQVLGPADADDLAWRLVNGLTYDKASDWIFQKTGKKVSTAGLSNFYQHYCQKRLLAARGGPLDRGTRRYVIIMDVRADGGFDITSFRPADAINQPGPDGRALRRQNRGEGGR